MMCSTWLAAVFSVITSSAAISRFDSPWAISDATSVSRGESTLPLARLPATAPGGLAQLVQRGRDARAATHALPHGQTLAVKCLRVDKIAGQASQIAQSVQ